MIRKIRSRIFKKYKKKTFTPPTHNDTTITTTTDNINSIEVEYINNNTSSSIIDNKKKNSKKNSKKIITPRDLSYLDKFFNNYPSIKKQTHKKVITSKIRNNSNNKSSVNSNSSSNMITDSNNITIQESTIAKNSSSNGLIKKAKVDDDIDEEDFSIEQIERQKRIEKLEEIIEKELKDIEFPVDSKININSFLNDKQIQKTMLNSSDITHVFPLHETLHGIKIQDLQGNTIDFTSLWLKKRVVIAIFRRFGCLICRLHALEISSIKSRLDKLGIPLIGIGFDPSGLEEFIEGKFFNGDIYLDPTRAVYRALNIKRMGFWDSAVGFTDPRLSAYRKKAKEIGMPSNFKGDGMQLGGTLVIGPQPQSAHYDFRQQNFTDIFDLNKILSACKLPYPEVNEITNNNNNNVNIQLPPPILKKDAQELHFSINLISNSNNNQTQQQEQKQISSQQQQQKSINYLAVDHSQVSSPGLSTRSSSSVSLNTSRSTPDLKSTLTPLSTLAKSPNRYSTFILDSYFDNGSSNHITTNKTETDNINNDTDDIIKKFDNNLPNNDLLHQYNNDNDNNSDDQDDYDDQDESDDSVSEENDISLVEFFTKIHIEPISLNGQNIFINPPSTGFYDQHRPSTNSNFKIELNSQKLIYNPY